MPDAAVQDRVHGIVGDGEGEVAGSGEGEQQDGGDGADRAQGDEAEAVLTGIPAAHREGDAHAEGHDEGHRDGPGGDAAGIEGEGEERALPALDKDGRQAEQHHVEEQQDTGQVAVEQDLDDGDEQEQAHAQSHGCDEHGPVHDGAYLAGQDRKVRLRHRDEDAHHEADTEQDAQLLGFGEAFADVLPHRGHRHVGAQVEEADAGHQEDGRAGEYEQLVPGNVHPRGYRKQKYQQADRYDRNQGFPEFLPQGFPKVPKDG